MKPNDCRYEDPRWDLCTCCWCLKTGHWCRQVEEDEPICSQRCEEEWSSQFCSECGANRAEGELHASNCSEDSRTPWEWEPEPEETDCGRF